MVAFFFLTEEKYVSFHHNFERTAFQFITFAARDLTILFTILYISIAYRKH